MLLHGQRAQILASGVKKPRIKNMSTFFTPFLTQTFRQYLFQLLSLRNEIIYLKFNQVPRRSKWEIAGRMRVARYGMAAVPLANSNFMVIGGQSNKTTGKFFKNWGFQKKVS